MRESDKRRTPNSYQTKRVAKTDRRAVKPTHLTTTPKKVGSKARRDTPALARGDSNTGSEASEAYDNVVIDYVDCVNRFEEVSLDSQAGSMAGQVGKDDCSGDHYCEFDDERKPGKEDESDSETVNESVSSQGDSLIGEEEKVEKASRADRSVSDKNSGVSGTRSGRDGSKPQSNGVSNATKNVAKSNNGASKVASKNAKDLSAPPKPSSESSEGVDYKAVEDMKKTDAVDEALNGAQSFNSDSETVDADENCEHEDEAILNQKIEEMEMRIEKLEEELREVAALEISLYSVVPEHGSSAHKVHTPARRLSRLYIHACKHWAQEKRGTIAKNTTSGLVLIAKSCGNDVPRLTFWLSNTIVLREIISQAFGSSRQSSMLARISEGNGNGKRNDAKAASLKWKSSPGNKQVNGSMSFFEDWQETGTFIAALEKVETWIFSRIVESVWWQALTPHMQPPSKNLSSNKSSGKLLGPALGDQQQGSFSINLWRTAFKDAFQRLCPVRAGGHDCGCLPVISRMVMEQCVGRLDVAMFNAILRESAHEIPTDPVSDPIVDSRVLPIPAGNLSFGSGAQLKNSVGNWSRWLTDMFGMDADDHPKEDQQTSEDDESGVSESKSFPLLNDLSDLLMLPKDMLMDRSIRHEVCPSISLPLIKRILCNFTPDEFCPDAVPGAVLEALNAESIVERRLSADAARNFPYTAALVVYKPPCSDAVAEKVAEAGTGAQLSRNVSIVQRKGYTSDEELEELDCPLASIVDKSPLSHNVAGNGNGNRKHKHSGKSAVMNARYDLLCEVWSE